MSLIDELEAKVCSDLIEESEESSLDGAGSFYIEDGARK